jgi:hypothetical protein
MEHTHREYNILQFLAQLMAIMGRVGAIRVNKVLSKVLEEKSSHNTRGECCRPKRAKLISGGVLSTRLIVCDRNAITRQVPPRGPRSSLLIGCILFHRPHAFPVAS